MKRDVKVYLEDIIESINLIEEYSRNTSKESFEKDSKLQDAIIRRIEIIGEAVKRVPQEVRDKHPEIPWKDAAATRDVFTHDYFGIIPERVWQTVNKDLPDFKEKIESLIKKLADE